MPEYIQNRYKKWVYTTVYAQHNGIWSIFGDTHLPSKYTGNYLVKYIAQKITVFNRGILGRPLYIWDYKKSCPDDTNNSGENHGLNYNE